MSLKYGVKTKFRQIISHSPIYYNARRRLQQPFDPAILTTVVRNAVEHVPFYRDYQQYLDNGTPFNQLPILQKEQIVGHEREMVDSRIPSFLLRKGETGGTSGISLTRYNTLFAQIRRFAMADQPMNLIGSNLTLATIRGFLPADNQAYQIVDRKHILLSSYRLSPETIQDYVNVLQNCRVECIHAYPSALLTLCKYIEQCSVTPEFPHLKGILTSSEVLSPDTKRLARRVFPEAKIVDYFGQSEAYCAAYSVNDSPYVFNNNFGYTEFIETGQTTPEGHRIAEIVATNILCNTMQYIRMATSDFVELDSDNNVTAILGRQADFLIDRNNAPVACIVIISDEAFANVVGFQFWQPKPGQLVFRVTVNDKFNEHQRQLLLRDISQTFVTVDCDVAVVDEISKTKAGKQKRVVHDFDIKPYL